MTEEERTGACVVALFAALAFMLRPPSSIRPGEDAWYRWCVEQYAKARHPFTASVFWSMRMADDDGEEWLGYVEHCLGNQRVRA